MLHLNVACIWTRILPLEHYLVAYLFLFSIDADFVQHLQKNKFKAENTSFNLTFRYIDDVLS